MAQYAILRFSKHKIGSARSIEAHHERQKEQYASNPDIDPKRSKYNFHLVKPQASYKKEIDSRITAAGCRTRKDSVRFVDTLVTASHAHFKEKKASEIKAYFEYAADFLFQRLGKQNVVSAVVHMDEKTPHMHLTFVPLTADNRLCAKEILGNRADLSRWQDDFHAHMVKKYPNLERGELSIETGRRHIPMRVFKQAENLSKQAKKIETLLDDKNPLTARKSKDEAQALLKKWFPQRERFETELKKYRGTIRYLQQENTELAETAESNRENKIETQIKIGKLEIQVQDYQRFYNAVPEEMRRQIEAEQRSQKPKEKTL